MKQKRTGKRTLFIRGGMAVVLIGALLFTLGKGEKGLDVLSTISDPGRTHYDEKAIHFDTQGFGDLLSRAGEVSFLKIDAKALPAADRNASDEVICPSCQISPSCEGIRSLGLFSLLFLSLLVCVVIFEISRRLPLRK